MSRNLFSFFPSTINECDYANILRDDNAPFFMGIMGDQWGDKMGKEE